MMTREQAIAWLTLEGWVPVGKIAPSHWYGVIKSNDVLVGRHVVKGDAIRHEVHRTWYKLAVRRDWAEGLGDAEVFARYIQKHNL